MTRRDCRRCGGDVTRPGGVPVCRDCADVARLLRQRAYDRGLRERDPEGLRERWRESKRRAYRKRRNTGEVPRAG